MIKLLWNIRNNYIHKHCCNRGKLYNLFCINFEKMIRYFE